MSEEKPSAFVTYGWCRSSYITAYSLGNRGIDVHVGDTSTFAMSRFSRYCKSFTKLPDFFIEPDKYFDDVCAALKKTGAKVLLPCHEDVGIFSKNAASLPSDIKIALPDWSKFSIAEDKFDLLELAQQAGCPVPNTIEVDDLSQLDKISDSFDFPVILKTRIGNSAKGIRIVSDKSELISNFNELIQTYHLRQERWPVIQEYLPSDAIGVCVLYDNGKCVASFSERYIRCKTPGKFGTSTFRETYEDKNVLSQALSVLDKLKWHGVAHLDFVADKNGQFKLIEINPRLWGALSLSVFSGIDFPYLWYLLATEKLDQESIDLQFKNIKCRWIVGDLLAIAELLKRGRIIEALKVVIPNRGCYHDDFNIKDPLPLMFECIDYIVKFVKSGFSSNPVTEGMIR